ncbi:MAG: GIY-YIG nuclease family protein [Alphaproteobacteria bacterium]
MSIKANFAPGRRRNRPGFLYIIGDATSFYVGTTSDLGRCVRLHKSKAVAGIAARLKLDRLLYYEEFGDISQAIALEKVLAGWPEGKQRALIEARNPDFVDLSGNLPANQSIRRRRRLGRILALPLGRRAAS